MAKDKDDKGFQIPIEDASEPEGSQDETAGASASSPAGKAETPQPDNNDVKGEEAEKAEDVESDDVDAPDFNEDLIAEAEAVVEGAVADTMEAIQAKAQEWQDRYLRLHAEWDTYRRRTQEQRADEKVRATEKLMENLLPVLDDFERTVAYAEENGEAGLLDGVKAVQTKLVDALMKSGLQVIDPAGEPYDALEAQAVQMVPDEEAFDETVKDVYQKGYKMGKKVLRPAMVTVTTGGPKRPKEEGSEEE